MASDKPGDQLTATRWVCSACHGVYFVPINGVCPGCKGQGKEREVIYDEAGVARVVE